MRQLDLFCEPVTLDRAVKSSPRLITIGRCKADGVRNMTINCQRCRHETIRPWGNLPDDLPFAHVQKVLPVRCGRCGNSDPKRIVVLPDWSDYWKQAS